MAERFSIYRGKKVLVTGHTGFKGSWLSLWLHELGANVSGYALPPSTTPSLFDVLALDQFVDHAVGDIRDADAFARRVAETKPDIVFHLAAQPLVRDSYRDPRGTFLSNANGTLNLLEAVREQQRPVALVLITTDKVYRNENTGRAFVETDPYGGDDPYSMSKAVCELIIDSYRASFFRPENFTEHGVAVASVRAGNCIGGGDFSAERLVPDLARAFLSGRSAVLRNPAFTRPWQHVLEPLYGYLTLGEKLLSGDPARFMTGYNFAPDVVDAQPVQKVAEIFQSAWGKNVDGSIGQFECAAQKDAEMHEAELLTLSYAKAQRDLGWQPTWNLESALTESARWYKTFWEKSSPDMLSFTRAQLREFTDQIASPQK